MSCCSPLRSSSRLPRGIALQGGGASGHGERKALSCVCWDENAQCLVPERRKMCARMCVRGREKEGERTCSGVRRGRIRFRRCSRRCPRQSTRTAARSATDGQVGDTLNGQIRKRNLACGMMHPQMQVKLADNGRRPPPTHLQIHTFAPSHPRLWMSSRCRREITDYALGTYLVSDSFESVMIACMEDAGAHLGGELVDLEFR
jgi:hypothetical protein